MAFSREACEAHLNDFDPGVRREALETLWANANAGAFPLPAQTRAVNMHCHTFFSFNGYGCSPSAVAWKARTLGLGAAGLVDFDVLDGVDEFLAACRLLGLRACAGLETRIFVPEFADREINSPGEPGVAYHMAVGFAKTDVAVPGVLPELKATAQRRNRGVTERVNAFLNPLVLDYERDVLPLTPGGNATERHLCIAYDLKAAEIFPDEARRAAFWADKLSADPAAIAKMFADAPAFQGFIRSKLMKSGGPGYVKAEGPDFPKLDAFNAFGLANGAIPTLAWLDGTSAGERDMEELMVLMMQSGVAALNIIPDRNWNIKDPQTRASKVALLHDIIRRAMDNELPIVVGTELNAFGQRYADDFAAPEMEPLVEPAWDGALILHAHTAIAARGFGYTSAWAKASFSGAKAKNAFYRRAGELLTPSKDAVLDGVQETAKPEQILAALGNSVS